MAFRIYDEYELEQFMNKGLSPEPIVVSKGTGYSIVNYTFVRGEFKNDFVSANADFIKFDDTYSLSNGEYIEIDFLFTNFINPVYVLGGTGAVPNLRILPTSVQLTGNGSTVVFSTSIGSGRHILRFERSGSNILLKVDGIVIESVGVGTNTLFPYNILSRRDLVASGDISVYYVDFNGVKFNLNEPSGIITKATNGNTGTRFTSHIDGLTYINNIMIQPISI